RRLEASDKVNGDFSSIETGFCKPTNWIEKLNQRHANEIDGAYGTREKRKWPVDLMGGARHSARRPALTVDPKLRQTILDTEQLLKDDELTSHVLMSSPPNDSLPADSPFLGVRLGWKARKVISC